MRKIPGTLYILDVTPCGEEYYDFTLMYRKEIVFQQSNLKVESILDIIEDVLNKNSLSIPKNRIKKVFDDEIEEYHNGNDTPFMENTVIELLKESNEKTINEIKKIVITGLGNSGKTCIYKRVFERKTSWELLNSSITKGISYIDYELGAQFKPSIWDLGGQQDYLDKYHEFLSEKIFTKVNTLLFVIDVSDPQRFDKSIEEFTWASSELKKYNDYSNIYVLFHKIDLIQEPEKVTFFLKKRIIPIADNAIFTNTTIFNESLFSVWSDIIRKISPKSLYIRTFLMELKKIEEVEDALLIERRTGLTLGSTLLEMNEEVMLGMLSLLNLTLERVSKELKFDEIDKVTISTNNQTYRLYYLSHHLLLALILNNRESNDSIKKLEKIIQNLSINLKKLWGE